MHPPTHERERCQALISFHGTLVFFDPVAGCLRHGPIGTSAPNLQALYGDGDAVLSWHDAQGCARPLNRFAPDGCGIAAAGPATRLTVEPAEDGSIALHADGRYLSAEPDGAVACSRMAITDGARFLPIDAGARDRLGFILSQRWLGDAATGPQPMRGAAGHAAEIGGTRVPIRELIRAAEASVPAGQQPLALSLILDGWKLARYRLYRPLAYFAAYGRPEIFDCTLIAIRTLFENAQWDGDVMVLTDPANLDFAARLEPAFRARVFVTAIAAHDVLDYTLARYKIAALPRVWSYQPVIYIDTDVVGDAPLHQAMHALALSPEFHAVTESPLGHEADYYGRSLFEADKVAIPPAALGFSSGVFAFRNIAEQAELFAMIVASAYGFAMAHGTREKFGCFDQPFFNYVLHRTGAGTGALLNRIVQFQWRDMTRPEGCSPAGLMHFAGGVGEATRKLDLMRAYAESLAAVPVTTEA